MPAASTIAAISTPYGKGGVALIRVSGPEAADICAKVFHPKSGLSLLTLPSNQAVYGEISFEGAVIDDGLATLFRAPRSFTGEDTVEITCHGGILVTQRVLGAVFEAGALPAGPGEFTKRAFLNGRIDLSQAESVIDVINAQNELALKSSVSQLQGAVLEKIKAIRAVVLHEIAFIESALDDPEHVSLEGYPEQLREIMSDAHSKVKKLLDSSDNGKMLKEGINTAIVGKPNAGKSSLLNILVGEERAIVTEIAGTTRDILQEQIQIGGIGLNVIDTAGIRDTEDIVEKIGVNKSREYIEKADLIIYVVDSSTELDENDQEIIEAIRNKKAIVLLNKSDLDAKTDASVLQTQLSKPILSISAKNNTGIHELETLIEEMFFSGKLSFNDEVYITNIRQKNALAEAQNSLKMVLQSIADGMPEDFFTIDMMNAYEALGTIIGESVGEDLVNEIFSKFCMGK